MPIYLFFTTNEICRAFEFVSRFLQVADNQLAEVKRSPFLIQLALWALFIEHPRASIDLVVICSFHGFPTHANRISKARVNNPAIAITVNVAHVSWHFRRRNRYARRSRLGRRRRDARGREPGHGLGHGCGRRFAHWDRCGCRFGVAVGGWGVRVAWGAGDGVSVERDTAAEVAAGLGTDVGASAERGSGAVSS